MATLGDKLLDKRIVERNIAKGLVSKAEYEKHLADLADREGAYDQLAVELDDTADGVATE
jgi:polyribonucleotide nucleotidyltransferase